LALRLSLPIARQCGQAQSPLSAELNPGQSAGFILGHQLLNFCLTPPSPTLNQREQDTIEQNVPERLVASRPFVMTSRTASPSVSLILISHSYPPVLGGSEIEAQRVCAALIRRGHRVTVLCAGGPPMPDVSRWTDSAGVPVRIFARRQTGRLRDTGFALAVAWTLIKERRNYQLVYFLMQGLHLATGLTVARALGKPAVMKFSGSGLITMLRDSWLGRLELRWLQKWARRVMILNQGMVDEATSAGFDSRQLLWMPNPVETGEFAPCGPARRQELRTQWEIPSSALVTLFVGRLAPEKELGSLVGGFAAAAARVPGALLVFVGDGPSRREAEEQVRNLGIFSLVRFTGRLPVNEVLQWMQLSDIFALVSSNEGFPCSLVEAMSVGLPSVVSSIPANAQLIESGVHGLHSATCDQASIADCLVRLLTDPTARARMGEAARCRAIENYSTDKVLDRYEALFGEALSSPGAQA
jgi:glycosyltransferase involved in cell wall biosynthesis